MYLALLNNEEKEAFLGIAIHAAQANEVITDEENAMLRAYCQEMAIPNFDIDGAMSHEKAVSVIAKADCAHKKIILLEVLGLLEADHSFDEAEHAFAKRFAGDIGLGEQEIVKLDGLLKEYTSVLMRLNDAVGISA